MPSLGAFAMHTFAMLPCTMDSMGKQVHRLSGLDTEAKTATCAHCGPVTVKPRRWKRRDGSFSVSYICQTGNNQRLIDYQKKTGQAREWRRVHGAWRGSPEANMLNSARYRARARGLDFDLTKEDIVFPEFCPILGIPITPGDANGRDSSPSLDRKDNSRGYTKDNIQIISHRANRIKSDATKEELLAIAASM